MRAQHLDNKEDAFEEWFEFQADYIPADKELVKTAFYCGYCAGEAKGDTNGEG